MPHAADMPVCQISLGCFQPPADCFPPDVPLRIPACFGSGCRRVCFLLYYVKYPDLQNGLAGVGDPENGSLGGALAKSIKDAQWALQSWQDA